jgi:hypothetical protein
MPESHVGDRLFLFRFEPDKIFASPIVGFDQGNMRVLRNERDNVDRAYRWWGRAVNESKPFTSRIPVSAAPTAAFQTGSANSVDEFLQRIATIMRQ